MTTDRDPHSKGLARARADAQRWNRRYEGSATTCEGIADVPARVLLKAMRWLPASGRALDLACGRGANALWLAARGLEVYAWDISSRAIDGLAQRPEAGSIHREVRDVVARPPAAARFELIVVSRFLDRSLCPALAAALVPGGILCYQTFTHGLSNPDYLLAPNELLTLFPALDIRWYHEPGLLTQDSSSEVSLPNEVGAEPEHGQRAEAMLVAQRPPS